MKRFLKSVIAASSLLAVMGLVGCGGNNASKDKLLEEIKGLDAETDESVINELKIVNADGIYGNVHLPTTIGEKEVTWWSSDSAVINPKADGSIAPGAVERQSKDMTIKLAAKIGSGASATKYEQEVIVKAAPKELEDKDFEAYLFAHFVGESYGKTEDGVKIATGEQIFFALADVGQGLKFKDMNGSTTGDLKPVLSSKVGERGVRDPFICRSPEGDTFYLIATDLSVYTRGGWGNNAGQATKTGSHSIVLWESHDLVNWTEGRQIPVAREDAGMAWAPEMIYNEETGEYVIFFSSTILDDYSKGLDAKILYRDSVYYTTTRDFKHFGETKQFIPNTKYQDNITSRKESNADALNNDYRKVIDGSVIKIGDYYYSAAKDGGNDEEGGGIRIQKTTSLIPETDDEGNEYIAWEFVQNLADVGFQFQGRDATNNCFEGPEWFHLNQADRRDPNVDEIGLMCDFFANTSVGYVPWATTDIEDINNANNSWRQLGSSDYSWDSQTKRHGTILRITKEEANLLKQNFPIAQ